MVIINLTKGYKTKIDKENEHLGQLCSWYAHKGKINSFYARGTIREKKKKYKNIYLHRIITGAKKGEIVDHINGDTLDNRKSNLRIVTQSQNNANKKSTGITQHKNQNFKKRWIAQIQINNTHFRIGSFLTKEEAHEAYRKKHIEFFKEYSYFNRTKEC